MDKDQLESEYRNARLTKRTVRLNHRRAIKSIKNGCLFTIGSCIGDAIVCLLNLWLPLNTLSIIWESVNILLIIIIITRLVLWHHYMRHYKLPAPEQKAVNWHNNLK